MSDGTEREGVFAGRGVKAGGLAAGAGAARGFALGLGR